LLLAGGLKQPEFYWSPISTIVILLSPIDPMVLGWQRFAGTAIGAVLGALIASYSEPKWVVWHRNFCVRHLQHNSVASHCIPLCCAYAHHYLAGSSRAPALDRGYAPFRRSLPGNCGSASYNAGVAGTGEPGEIVSFRIMCGELLVRITDQDSVDSRRSC
jgi:hypothetical protein